jgi:hypothetical protein
MNAGTDSIGNIEIPWGGYPLTMFAESVVEILRKRGSYSEPIKPDYPMYMRKDTRKHLIHENS